MDNCVNCLYSDFLENGEVFCDKVILLYNKKIYVDASKVNLSCPSHSNRYIEDWRYTSEGVQDLRKAEDACEICGRLVDLDDESQYGYIEVQDEEGKVIGEKMQCKICREKGRR